ncbi:MAG TPA: FGGY family carbohydrate kinase [Phycisphaerae bacterium]|nr:FGGY family carbohydrate kinase [Phycisphaerae bacterium]
MLLGIDIGTTKIAAAVIDAAGRVHACVSRPHQADMQSPAGRSEQDPVALLAVARACVLELPGDLRAAVRAVGVTGQMHGIVLLDAAGQPVSPLVTWQDQRCLEGDFLSRVAHCTGHVLRTGFGLATLAWLVEHGNVPPVAKSCATIGNLLAAHLCGLSRSMIDPTDAAAWGLFDLATMGWDGRAVESVGIDIRMLPDLTPCGAAAGDVTGKSAKQWRLPAGTPVAVGIGDNQASLLATLDDCEHQLALTIGTGAQVSAVMPKGFHPSRPAADSPYEHRPYPGERLAIVAASLSGGVAWAWLARTVLRWQQDLGQPAIDGSAVYARLNELGAQADDGLLFEPLFAGERHAPTRRATISSIDLDNFGLGSVARALARGIVRNLKSMLPPEAFAERREVVGSGNALRRNSLLAQMVTEEFELPLRLRSDREEAAVGAALNAAGLSAT